jgi:hypothetical protein
MSTEQIQQLSDDLSTIRKVADMAPRMHSLMKLVIGAMIAASMAISSVAFWVKVTTDRLERAETNITSVDTRQQQAAAELYVWRASKDATDIRLTVVVENQQEILKAMTAQKLNRPD